MVIAAKMANTVQELMSKNLIDKKQVVKIIGIAGTELFNTKDPLAKY